MLKIREFTEADRVPLQEIYLASRSQTFYWMINSTFELNDFDKDTEAEQILVAETDGQVAGFIAIWMPDNFIHHLFVHPGFLKNGIGKALLNAGLGCVEGPATLKCIKRNENALGFYKAQGWYIEEDAEDETGYYYLMKNK